MMYSYSEQYDLWMSYGKLDSSLKSELSLVRLDEENKKDRFYTSLTFGTAGLRGLLGAGLNRMNIYTVAQATQGFAQVILGEGEQFAKKGVCICYDCRRQSYDFARLAAEVMAANGVPVRIFADMRPTPQLSFAIRHYGCAAGINITASHNPPEYNGYKVYWRDGAQLPTEQAGKVAGKIEKIDIFEGAKRTDFNSAVQAGMITILDERDDELYIEAVLENRIDSELIHKNADKLRVVYTPFHGVGGKIMPTVLERAGYKNVCYTAEQMEPDGTFRTVKSPNPEEPEGFALACEYAKKYDAHVIIGTDPDADRVGFMAKNTAGEYEFFTGNQTGALLLDYMLQALNRTHKMPKKPAFITTIVTSPMAKYIAQQNGIKCFETFTGFKNIAQTESAIAKKGYKYVLAFEESYGYMIGSHARDKDGIAASLLLLEMACYYGAMGLTLGEALNNLYRKYGGFAEQTISVVMDGEAGFAKMQGIMTDLRKTPSKRIDGVKVEYMTDYLSGKKLWFTTGFAENIALKGSNVIEMGLEDGTKYIVRPSGTEPKVKIYVLARGQNRDSAVQRAQSYTNDIRSSIKL